MKLDRVSESFGRIALEFARPFRAAHMSQSDCARGVILNSPERSGGLLLQLDADGCPGPSGYQKGSTERLRELTHPSAGQLTGLSYGPCACYP